MTDQEIAKALLEFYGGDEKKWTQGTWARIADQTPVAWAHPSATCWCIAGALQVLRLEEAPTIVDVTRFEDSHFGIIEPWNDAPGRSFAEVEAKLREIAGVG